MKENQRSNMGSWKTKPTAINASGAPAPCTKRSQAETERTPLVSVVTPAGSSPRPGSGVLSQQAGGVGVAPGQRLAQRRLTPDVARTRVRASGEQQRDHLGATGLRRQHERGCVVGGPR